MEDINTNSTPFYLEMIGWVLFAYQEEKMPSGERIRQGAGTLSSVSCHQHHVLPSGGCCFFFFFPQHFSFPVCVVGIRPSSTFTWALAVKCSKMIPAWFKCI